MDLSPIICRTIQPDIHIDTVFRDIRRTIRKLHPCRIKERIVCAERGCNTIDLVIFGFQRIGFSRDRSKNEVVVRHLIIHRVYPIASGFILSIAFILGAFHIAFRKRKSILGAAGADFILQAADAINNRRIVFNQLIKQVARALA